MRPFQRGGGTVFVGFLKGGGQCLVEEAASWGWGKEGLCGSETEEKGDSILYVSEGKVISPRSAPKGGARSFQ